MHLVWTGVAHVLAARGDASLEFVLQEAAQGEIFAFGNSEAGNDSVLFDSLTEATPLPDGGYCFTGTKIFTSLSPAWTRLGIFGKDACARDGEGELVHGFITAGHARLPDPGRLGHAGHAGQPVQHHRAGRRRCPARTASSGSCRWARTRIR